MTTASTSRIAVLAVLLLSLTANAAKVYKWTDANGQVHFSSTPPTDQSAEQVRMRGSANVEPPADASAADSATDASATDTPKTDKPELTPEQREQLTKYCGELRQRIATLGQGGKVLERKPDGSQVELNPVDVADRVREDKANEKNYCVANGL